MTLRGSNFKRWAPFAGQIDLSEFALSSQARSKQAPRAERAAADLQGRGILIGL
jgi:hypothetical protein